MAKTRREFTREFKHEAVALWEASGRPQVEIAAEFGIQPSQLRRWQKVFHGPSKPAITPAAVAAPGASRAAPGASTPTPADLAAENARLRRELDRARAERDILKKAIGIFSEMPR